MAGGAGLDGVIHELGRGKGEVLGGSPRRVGPRLPEALGSVLVGQAAIRADRRSAVQGQVRSAFRVESIVAASSGCTGDVLSPTSFLGRRGRVKVSSTCLCATAAIGRTGRGMSAVGMVSIAIDQRCNAGLEGPMVLSPSASDGSPLGVATCATLSGGARGRPAVVCPARTTWLASAVIATDAAPI